MKTQVEVVEDEILVPGQILSMPEADRSRWRRPHIRRSGAGACEVVAGVEKGHGVELEVAHGVEHVALQDVELGAFEA